MLHNFNTTLFYRLIYRCFLKINYMQYWLIVRTIAKFYFDIFFSLFKFNKWYIRFNFIDHSFFLFVSIKYIELKKKKKLKEGREKQTVKKMPQIIPGLLVTEYSNILRLRQIKKPLSYCFLTSKKKKKIVSVFANLLQGKKKIYFSILFLISARDITCSEISIPE